jgi:hypothetical protein
MLRTLHKTFFLPLLLGLALFPLISQADTLLFSPSSGSYKVGQTFSVRVVVSSPAQAVNAVSAKLSFPTDKLQVTSVSKIGSILNLWVEEPSFSNSQGTVSMEGVVPNPGFKGNGGPVLTINFRVLKDGPADLQYVSGQLLANDGYGTNILKNKGTASFTLLEAPAPQVAPVEPTVESESEPSLIDLGESARAPAKTEAPAPKKVSFEVPSFDSIYSLLIKILSLAIPLIALVYLFVMTFHRGNQSVRKLKKNLRTDLRSVDRLVEKSFDLIKEDMSESIHMLERTRTKRKLTVEEDAIIHRLRQNLVDAEKIIHEEVTHAEKDLGD